MDAVIADSVAARRFTMLVLAIFASVALVLGCVGIYSVVSHAIRARTHEMAIRLALGARPRGLLGMVFRRGAAMALPGVTAGLAASLWLTRFMEHMLFGIQPHDPFTMGGVGGLSLAVTFAACFVPARRAARVDPMQALRQI